MLPRIPRIPYLATRRYSTAPPTESILISNSTSPYFNLTLEDWLFRKTPPERPVLFLYRDEPCVVIGRNQNPWKEINFPALRATGIPFIRRRSGGGTVYHDLGNTNFSIHLPRSAFNRRHTTKLVQKALLSLDIPAEINERNDICVDGFKIILLYVSGSAYKIINSRAYHHGTMLISTELNTLGDLLRNTKGSMVSRGVASVRSPVHNLQRFKPDVTHAAFIRAVIENFKDEYDVDTQEYVFEETTELHTVKYVKEGMAELQAWNWKYGQTPEFTYKLSNQFSWGKVTADIASKHGIILSLRLSVSDANEWCEQFGNAMIGAKYALLDGLGDTIDGNDGNSQRRKDILEWLREEM
ncbi:hypothetical protein BU17DRAFT_74741 [Hysterangium stoloniferum]|nr:hypothetical protein BU17DRAFT_74741 [Hysterangium stoloniferum]